MNDPVKEGAQLAFEAALRRMRSAVHPGGCTDGQDDDEKLDFLAVRDRIACHAAKILEAVEEFDHYRVHYRKIREGAS